MEIEFKYCPSCGKENKAISSPSNNNNENNIETSTNRLATFKAFLATKHEGRSSHYKPAKKQRLLGRQELTINIGLMEFNEEGLASPLRGKTLPQKIAKNADYKTVFYIILVYSDGQSAKNHPWVCPYFFLWKGTNLIRRYTHELEGQDSCTISFANI